MINTKVEIVGKKVLQAKLELLGEEYAQVAFEEEVAGAERVRAQAWRSAPRISNDLANSLEVEQDPKELAVNVGTRLFYAPWVHHGTKRIRANPFLFNAFEAEVPNVIDRIKARIADARVKVSRRGGR